MDTKAVLVRVGIVVGLVVLMYLVSGVVVLGLHHI